MEDREPFEDRDRIEDSIEFCRDIKIYYQNTESKPNNNVFLRYTSLSKESYTSRSKLPEYEYIQQEASEDPPANSMFKEVTQFAVYLMVVFVLAKLFTTYIGHHTMVEGHSMEDTLSNHDILIVDRMSYLFKEPSRFDIIIFPYSKDTYYIKRIIGLPGETVQIDESQIFIDGQVLEDDYALESSFFSGIVSEPITLKDDEYFVLGDNRNNSKDSRSPDVGPIKRKQLKGKAIFRLYPFREFGSLN